MIKTSNPVIKQLAGRSRDIDALAKELDAEKKALRAEQETLHEDILERFEDDIKTLVPILTADYSRRTEDYELQYVQPRQHWFRIAVVFYEERLNSRSNEVERLQAGWTRIQVPYRILGDRKAMKKWIRQKVKDGKSWAIEFTDDLESVLTLAEL